MYVHVITDQSLTPSPSIIVLVDPSLFFSLPSPSIKPFLEAICRAAATPVDMATSSSKTSTSYDTEIKIY